jgi:hypothetical protein
LLNTYALHNNEGA